MGNIVTQSNHQPTALTLEIIKSIVEDGIRAPSGDNCQPWKFKWDGQKLLIFHSEILGKHEINKGNHCSMLALGALIESMKISATRFSLRAEASVPDNDHFRIPELHWAEMAFVPANMEVDPLAAFISKRTTDRQIYQKGTLKLSVLKSLADLSKDFQGCSVSVQTKQSEDFLKYILDSEKLLWTNPKIIRDLGKWLRLTRTEIASSKDGMNRKNIGVNQAEGLFFQLVRKFPSIPKWLWSLGFGGKVKSDVKKAIQSSSALLCFTAKSTTPDSFCQIGSLAFRSWLTLTANGYAVQPLSLSSVSIADLESGLADHFNEEEIKVFSTGRNILMQNFNLNKEEIPVWLFRTGLSPGLPSDSRTLRRKVEDFFES